MNAWLPHPPTSSLTTSAGQCDAAVPICSRCTYKGLACSYTPSRRGCGARSRRLQSPRPTLPPTPGSEPTDYLPHGGQHRPPPMPYSGTAPTSDASSLSQRPQEASTPGSSSTTSSLRSEDEHLTNLYYSNFHPGHPILLPRSRCSDKTYPPYLRATVKLIGSYYAPGIASDPLQTILTETLRASDARSPEMVQTLLLYVLLLHSRYEPMEATACMSRAVEMAISLGMHTAEFAANQAQGDALYEESLRRTWWELYITDGYLAALHRNTSFRSNTVASTTLLPCEESAYAEGRITITPSTLEMFEDRLFSDEEWRFSSYCYRIDAVRILARVIAVSTNNAAKADTIQAIDNAIASWQLHLPNEKARLVSHGGEMDHLMFQAFTFIRCASIFLHFPRSELPITMPPAADVACAQQHMEQVSPTSTQHAVKALSASKELANLATLPAHDQSPLFICGLVFACIVQLSACCAYSHSDTQQNRDRVALIIGALKSLSRQWPIAQHVTQQLKRAANEIFKPRAVASIPTSSPGPSASDFATFPADLSWLDIFYSEGMQNQLLPEGEMTSI